MSCQFATAFTSPNTYITHTVNNMNFILTLNKKKMKYWTKKYYKIIQGLETIANI